MLWGMLGELKNDFFACASVPASNCDYLSRDITNIGFRVESSS